MKHELEVGQLFEVVDPRATTSRDSPNGPIIRLCGKIFQIIEIHKHGTTVRLLDPEDAYVGEAWSTDWIRSPNNTRILGVKHE